MSFRIAKSLDVLRSQINARYPNRSKLSDGWIGDAAHASRTSDHNPWVKNKGVGIVTALDITHDPSHGVDCSAIVEWLRGSKDARIKYIIWNGRICASYKVGANKPWEWRAYTGANKHTKHFHLSVSDKEPLYDSATPWKIPAPEVSTSVPKTAGKTTEIRMSIVRIEGVQKKGEAVSSLSVIVETRKENGLWSRASEKSINSDGNGLEVTVGVGQRIVVESAEDLKMAVVDRPVTEPQHAGPALSEQRPENELKQAPSQGPGPIDSNQLKGAATGSGKPSAVIPPPKT